MSGYGFRLYTVKLVNGSNKSKAIDFSKCGMKGDQHVSVWVRRALDLLEGYQPLTGYPLLEFAVDEDASDLPTIKSYVVPPKRGQYRTDFVSHTASPITRIRFTIYYGRTGKVTVGVQDGQPLPLAHIPTGDAYRGILYLPATGEKGLLALESVPSAPNPQRMLNKWLARAAIDLAMEDQVVIDTMDPEKVAQDKLKAVPFKLNFNQYPNVDRIEKAVNQSKTAKVVFRQDGISGGGVKGDEGVTVTSTLHQEKRRKKAGKLAKNMLRGVLGQLEDDEEPVTLEELEELVEGSLDGFEWSDAYIQIDDETGLKKIGLEKVDKYFIYPTGSGTPLSDKKFEQAVAREVVDLQAALGLDLDLS